MNTRIVLWGEIGTDRKALVAIHLEEATAKIHIYAFPKEQVTKELQDALFVEWKNGGDFEFPETAIHWEVDANSDTILPETVKVERPEVVLQSQHKWSKKLMSSRINQLLADEIKFLEEKASAIGEYDQALWDKAKAQWEKIFSYQKKNEISWEQTTALKERINAVFDALKAVKRINNENEDQANAVLVKQYNKRIEDLQSKLIYPDQWKLIFEDLKKIQAELKELPIRWNHKRALYNSVNAIYDDLKKYRATEIITKTQGRITQLQKILDGLKDSIARDQENYNMQVEKMQHYTRGKLPEDEIKSRFSFITDRMKEKETKAEGIRHTIAQLKSEIEKEKKQQTEREEQQRIKREQEAAKKEQDAAPESEDASSDEATQAPPVVREKQPGKRTHTKRAIQKINDMKAQTESVKDASTASAEEPAGDTSPASQPEESAHKSSTGEPAENAETAESIVAENNAGLPPVLEADGNAVEPLREDTPESVQTEHHPVNAENPNDYKPSAADAPADVDAQITQTTDKAVNNPD
jgi:hypothetical protein